MHAARLAASGVELLGKQVEIVDDGQPNPVKLAALADDADVLGAITIDGGHVIDQAGEALDRWMLPVFELRNDLYERQALRPSVFQMSVPHSWEAYRLARYFGPGDRGYRRVGLIRTSSSGGEVAAVSLREAASLRGLDLVETDPLPVVVDASSDQIAAVLSKLREARVEVVVAEASDAQLMEVNRLLSSEAFNYEGKRRIADGWRPQLAGFDSLFSISEMRPGTVAAGEYGRPVRHVDSIPAIKSFVDEFEKANVPTLEGKESVAYDAVKFLAESVKRAGANDHEKVVQALEGFDRVRFARLPVSFSPTDHVAPERDHLGLWAVPTPDASKEPWFLLMRTFTSDLERTNILEEDWPSFFDGTTPGGEAPFFHQAKRGIVSDKSDDLH